MVPTPKRRVPVLHQDNDDDAPDGSMFSFLRVSRPHVLHSFAQTVLGTTLLHTPSGRPRVRFPWPSEDVDLSNIAVHLPVDLIVESSPGRKIFDSSSSSSETAVSRSKSSLPESSQHTQLSTKDLPSTSAPILQLPGEVLNLIFSFLTEPADYEIKWLGRSPSLTHWRYVTPRASLEPRVPHGIEKRVREKGTSYETVYNWGPNNRWSHHFTSQWMTPAVDTDLTLARRAKFRAGRRLHNSNAVLKLEYVRGATAAIMACKRFHEAGASHFYENKGFSFGSRSLFDVFVGNLTPATCPWITRVYLYHEPYGEPRFTCYLPIRDTDAVRWDETCRKAAKTLTGMQVQIAQISPSHDCRHSSTLILFVQDCNILTCTSV